MFFQELDTSKAQLALQVKEDTKPYQAPPMYIASASEQLFKKELEYLQAKTNSPLGYKKKQLNSMIALW